MGCQNSTIPDSVKIIGDYAFYNCRNLTNILLPSGLTTIGKDAFYYTGITSITIPASVTEIGRWAFSSCSSLTKTNYLGTLKDWVSIDFKGNYSDYSNPIYYSKNLYINSVLITSITAEDLQGVTSIGNSAFNNCQSLTSVVLPSSITNIGSSAFYGCKNLTSFTIPSSVTNIGQYAFYNCTGLLSTNGGAGITFEGSTTWEKANNSTFTSYLSTVDVTNANQNATWLVSTNKYYNYYWRKA